MSSIEAARALRSANAKRSRNILLKASCSASELANLMASSSQSDYAQRRAALNRFKKKSKDETQKTTAKVTWLHDHKRLGDVVQQGDRMLSEILGSLLTNVMSGDAGRSVILHCIQEVVEYQSKHGAYSRGLGEQLREVNGLIHQFAAKAKSKRKGKEEDNHGNRNSKLDDTDSSMKDENKENQSSDRNETNATTNQVTLISELDAEAQAQSMIAHMLVEMRKSHNEYGDNLKKDVELLEKEVGVARRQVWTMLRGDYRAEQDKKLREDLVLQKDDTIETQLFMEDWFKRVHTLDETHNDVMAKLSIELDECKNALQPSGWSEEDRTTFSKIMKHAETVGHSRARLNSTLRSQLPQMNESALHAYEQFYNSHKNIIRRKRESLKSHENARVELLSSAKLALAEFRETQRLALEREKEAERRRLLAEELRRELELMHMDAAQRQAEEDARKAEMERLQHEAEERQKAKRDAEFEQKRLLVEAFKEARQAADAADAARIQAAAEKRAREMEETIEKNRPNVERRQILLEQKRMEQEKKEELLLEEQRRRAIFLQALADSVKPDVDSRLDDTTVAVEAQKYVEQGPLHRGHMPLNGFTNSTLFKDARFRLGFYLHEAGVQGSVVAKAVVQKWNPRPNAPLPTIW